MQLDALVGGAAEVIGREATLAEAADRMVDRAVDCLAVVDGADTEDELVSGWMSEAPDTFGPDVSVQEATEWLMQTGYRHLPVMAGGELLGVVSIRDLLFAMQTKESG